MPSRTLEAAMEGEGPGPGPGRRAGVGCLTGSPAGLTAQPRVSCGPVPGHGAGFGVSSTLATGDRSAVPRAGQRAPSRPLLAWPAGPAGQRHGAWPRGEGHSGLSAPQPVPTPETLRRAAGSTVTRAPSRSWPASSSSRGEAASSQEAGIPGLVGGLAAEGWTRTTGQLFSRDRSPVQVRPRPPQPVVGLFLAPLSPPPHFHGPHAWPHWGSVRPG